MTLQKHNLVDEFPQHRDRIHALKVEDPQFAKLFAEYHDVDHEINRIEQEVETPGDDYIEQLKMRRVHLKDDLYRRITAAG